MADESRRSGLFEALIGNRAAAEFLRAALAAGSLSHAYLLTGQHHIGKRTLGTALAAGLVCQGRPVPGASLEARLAFELDLPLDETGRTGSMACGRCRACRLVAKGAHPDVRLVEPESGRRGLGIEQIRQLEHDAGLRPYEAVCKVFILAGVETMTEPASNALLTTLEEPPDDTYLILTATDRTSVLPTISSRCQEVALRPVPADEIGAALESRGVERERAQLLARLAAGRPGWALAALEDETLLAAREKGVALLERVLAQPPVARLHTDALGDTADVRDLLDVWLGWWRDALLVREGCDRYVAGIDRLETLRHAGVDTRSCLSALQRIQETREQIDANANVRLAIESLLLDLPQIAVASDAASWSEATPSG